MDKDLRFLEYIEYYRYLIKQIRYIKDDNLLYEVPMIF